jgi:hypothetical protein
MFNILPVSKAALLRSVIICCIVIVNVIMLLSFLSRKPPVTKVVCKLGYWRRCWAWGYTTLLLGCPRIAVLYFSVLTQWCFCSWISQEESSPYWLNVVLLLPVYRLLFHMAAHSAVGGMRLFTIPQCTVTAQRFGSFILIFRTFFCLFVATYALKQRAPKVGGNTIEPQEFSYKNCTF